MSQRADVNGDNPTAQGLIWPPSWQMRFSRISNEVAATDFTIYFRVSSLAPGWLYIDGLVQYCSISSALAMEILQSCNQASIYHCPNANKAVRGDVGEHIIWIDKEFEDYQSKTKQQETLCIFYGIYYRYIFVEVIHYGFPESSFYAIMRYT